MPLYYGVEQLIKTYRRGNLQTERLFPRYFFVKNSTTEIRYDI